MDAWTPIFTVVNKQNQHGGSYDVTLIVTSERNMASDRSVLSENGVLRTGRVPSRREERKVEKSKSAPALLVWSFSVLFLSGFLSVVQISQLLQEARLCTFTFTPT